jgi:hypothetical protein
MLLYLVLAKFYANSRTPGYSTLAQIRTSAITKKISHSPTQLQKTTTLLLAEISKKYKPIE